MPGIPRSEFELVTFSPVGVAAAASGASGRCAVAPVHVRSDPALGERTPGRGGKIVAGRSERGLDPRRPAGLRQLQQLGLEAVVEDQPFAQRRAPAPLRSAGQSGPYRSRIRRQHLGDREVHGVDQRGAALGALAGRELRQQAAYGGRDADGVGG